MQVTEDHCFQGRGAERRWERLRRDLTPPSDEQRTVLEEPQAKRVHVTQPPVSSVSLVCVRNTFR